jgi:DNA-binding response OmpR family regulator
MRNKKVIVAIDDMPEILMTINEILSENYDVRLAKNALAASAIFHAVIPDLILLDVEMPGLSGLDFLESIRERPDFKTVPVIFVTSNGVSDTVARALNLGAKGYLVKPIEADKLREKVRATLEK